MILVERRIGLLFAGFLALMAIAGLRSLQLGTLKGSQLSAVAVSQHISEPIVPAHRGTITDRHGVELAVAQPADDISTTPYLVKDKAGTARKLAPLLGVPEPKLLADLSRTDTGFVYLKKTLPGGAADKVRALDLPGIDFEPAQIRTYPRDYLASQVLGSVNAAGHGSSGLEYALDAKLHGADGQERIVRDGVGAAVGVSTIKPTVPGARVELALDANIQDKVENVLKGIGQTYEPKGATAMVTNPQTGEILALANWPQVNANAPSAAPDWANQDRAVGYTYEPGSTFKAATIGGALEDGLVTPSTELSLPSQITLYDRTVTNAEPRPPETMTVSDVLARSDNVGAITIGRMEKPSRFDYWTHEFGFGEKTGTDLPGEEQGLILPPKRWSGTSILNLPIGQGNLVTPIQIAQFYGAIANGGILRTPHVVRRINGRPEAQPKARRVMSRAVAAQLRTMLAGVFKEGGTAHEVSIPGYTLAGKTGTASKIDPKTGQYSQSAYVASFVGFAPAQHPKLLISVMVDEPKGSIYGASVAAPAFAKIANFALNYLKIPPQ